MKLTPTRLMLLATLLSLMTACQEKSSTKSSSNSSNLYYTGGTTGGSTTGTTTGGSTTGGTTSGSTTGSTTGGTTTGGASANVYHFKAIMAGGQSWYVGYQPTNSNVMGDFVALTTNNAGVFASDSRFKVKIKVLGQAEEGIKINNINANTEVCAGRNFPMSQSPDYTKLSLTVGIRDIYNNGGTLSLGTTYATKTVNQINVGAYSPVLDWSLGQFPGRNTGGNIVGHAIVVQNVLSNSLCLTPASAYCPVSNHPTKACWGVQIELATDVTQDF